MKYSVIVPVYNRPDEVEELLESLTLQGEPSFEVIIVEDGSKTPCRQVCERYKDRLDIHYYYKDNSGGAKPQLWCRKGTGRVSLDT